MPVVLLWKMCAILCVLISALNSGLGRDC